MSYTVYHDATGEFINTSGETVIAMYDALKEIIPATDNAEQCYFAYEAERELGKVDPKTREYLREAKIRLMAARRAVNAALERALEGSK